MTTPLTLIVEGKPLVFDNPAPVGEVIPRGSSAAVRHDDGTWTYYESLVGNLKAVEPGHIFTARPPVAPESFVDGDVAWVRVESDGENVWIGPDGEVWLSEDDGRMRDWIAGGRAICALSPRPESLADVLDDANLPDELRARIEKAVGA